MQPIIGANIHDNTSRKLTLIMAPTLYSLPASYPVRSVLVTAKAIGLDLNEKIVNLLSGEHLTPEFVKINPQHTIPVLVDDDGFTVIDSHAIIRYLVSKYAKNDSLYPKDLKKRTLVEQRLHFHAGTLFPRLRRITKSIALDRKTTIDQRDIDSVIEAYGFFEALLQGNKWAAGDFLSIADYSLGTSISSIADFVPIDPQKFPNVTAWFKRVQELPEFEANKQGHRELKTLLEAKLGLK